VVYRKIKTHFIQ